VIQKENEQVSEVNMNLLAAYNCNQNKLEETHFFRKDKLKNSRINIHTQN